MIRLDHGFILEYNNSDDKRKWDLLVRNYFYNEPMYLPEYLKLFASNDDGILCAVYQGQKEQLIYPFILRNIPEQNVSSYKLENLRDIITPYGYGGPLTNGESLDEITANLFWQSFERWCKDNKIITEFIRFALNEGNRSLYPGHIEIRSLNIIRSLTDGFENIWMDFNHKVRKNVKKAQELGIELVIDRTGERLHDFLSIYNSTMDRRNAKESYYFDEHFFERIHRELQGNFLYFYALVSNEPVSTELILYSDKNIYSYLGGTRESFFNYRPNDFIKYEVIRWGCENKKHSYILGGGYTPEDGIFRYKKNLAPNGIVDFKVGKRIFDVEIYDRLVEEKMRTEKLEKPQHVNFDFFPLYRI